MSFRKWLIKQGITCDDYDAMEEQERQCLVSDFYMDLDNAPRRKSDD